MKSVFSAAVLAVWLGGCGSSDTDTGGGAGSTTGSSGGTAGAGGTATGGGTAGTGAGGAVPVEDCLDGIDTDGDGDVDCEDLDCQADFECVDGPVSGWSGAVRVQKVPYPAAAAPDLCPGGKPPAIYASGPSAPECAACQCELVGTKCNAPQMSCSTSSYCLTGPAGVGSFQQADTDCQGAPGPPGGYAGCWLTKGAAVQENGECSVRGGGLATQEAWADEVRVCIAAGAGCGAGKVCAPKAPVGFEPQVCMTQEGGLPCPSDWTSLDLAVYEGGTDHRACSPCSCDTSAVKCIGGKYTLYPSAGCPAVGATEEVDSNTCVNVSSFLPDGAFSYQAELGMPTGQVCSPALPSGSVETTGPRRICCRHQTP